MPYWFCTDRVRSHECRACLGLCVCVFPIEANRAIKSSIHKENTSCHLLIQKTHLCGCVTVGREMKRDSVVLFCFVFCFSHPVSLQPTTSLDRDPVSPCDSADPCPTRCAPVCLASARWRALFSCGTSLSCFVSEKIFWPQRGVC